jgi:hypothetical protein
MSAPVARLNEAREQLRHLDSGALLSLYGPDLRDRIDTDDRGEPSARALAWMLALSDAMARRLHTPHCFGRLCEHARAEHFTAWGMTIDLSHGTAYCESCVEAFTQSFLLSSDATCEVCAEAGAQTSIAFPIGEATLLANVCPSCAGFSAAVRAWMEGSA